MKMRNMSRTPFSQRGLSIIELMIALLLCTLLILGVTQVYIDNKRTFLSQHDQNDTQDGSRFAMFSIQQLLLKTGYKTLAQDSREIAFPYLAAANGCQSFAVGQSVRPTANGRGVCIRYQRRLANETDCLGNVIATTNAIVTRLELTTATNELQCSAQGAAAQTLVSDVANIAFTYGIDTNDDRLAEAFVTTPAADAWPVSVRVSLLQRSSNNGTAIGQQSYFFPLSSTTATTATDTRLYNSAQTTVTLRNIAQ
jgi:type IV pilus assembly protein PilW